MKTFAEVQTYFQATYGLSLFLVEEPTAMGRSKAPSKWVGVNSETAVLLRRNGLPTTLYPKSKQEKRNAGRRPISLSTLISNIKDSRPIIQQVQ